jgi:hypothetical protein
MERKWNAGKDFADNASITILLYMQFKKQEIERKTRKAMELLDQQ